MNTNFIYTSKDDGKKKQDQYCKDRPASFYDISGNQIPGFVNAYAIETPICNHLASGNYIYITKPDGKIKQDKYCTDNPPPLFDVSGNQIAGTVSEYSLKVLQPKCYDKKTGKFLYTTKDGGKKEQDDYCKNNAPQFYDISGNQMIGSVNTYGESTPICNVQNKDRGNYIYNTKYDGKQKQDAHCRNNRPQFYNIVGNLAPGKVKEYKLSSDINVKPICQTDKYGSYIYPNINSIPPISERKSLLDQYDISSETYEEMRAANLKSIGSFEKKTKEFDLTKQEMNKTFASKNKQDIIRAELEEKYGKESAKYKTKGPLNLSNDKDYWAPWSIEKNYNTEQPIDDSWIDNNKNLYTR